MDYVQYRELELRIRRAERALADLESLRVQRSFGAELVDFTRREAAIDRTLVELYDQQADFASEALDEQERDDQERAR